MAHRDDQRDGKPIVSVQFIDLPPKSEHNTPLVNIRLPDRMTMVVSILPPVTGPDIAVSNVRIISSNVPPVTDRAIAILLGGGPAWGK